MSCLGFFADIAGVSKYLKTNDGKTKAMNLYYALGNDLYTIGQYTSKKNIARFLAYQMGDGFMVHFDTVKFSNGNCHGTAMDMVNLAIILAVRFLVTHNGILHIGLAMGELLGLSESGYDFAKLKNSNSGNGYCCGHGLFFLLPITGTLLAETYRLTNAKISGNNQQYRYEPRILINPNLHNSLLDMKDGLTQIKCKGGNVWQYSKFNNPNNTIKKFYKLIWHNDITAESIKDALKRYEESNANMA